MQKEHCFFKKTKAINIIKFQPSFTVLLHYRSFFLVILENGFSLNEYTLASVKKNAKKTIKVF